MMYTIRCDIAVAATGPGTSALGTTNLSVNGICSALLNAASV